MPAAVAEDDRFLDFELPALLAFDETPGPCCSDGRRLCSAESANMSVIESEKRFFIVLLPLWEEEKLEELALLVGVEGGVSVGEIGLLVLLLSLSSSYGQAEADGIVASVGRKVSTSRAIFTTIQDHSGGVVGGVSLTASSPLHALSLSLFSSPCSKQSPSQQGQMDDRIRTTNK